MREKGSILILGDTDVKTGELVCDTLKLEHPEKRERDNNRKFTFVWFLSCINPN